MTSTALVSLSGTALTEYEQAILQEAASDENAFDYIPTRLKFPSGGMNVFTANDGEIVKPPFKAIIAVSQKSRAWWPGKDTQGLPPLCSSPDGVNGHFDIEAEAQIEIALGLQVRHPALRAMTHRYTWACAECPLTAWGSGSGRGQACKALRRLIVLVEGWTMPAIMTVPPTSVKVLDGYASARARTKGQAYFTAWTRFGLEQQTNSAGIKYAVLKLEVDRALTEAEVANVISIRHQFASWVRELGIDSEDYDTGEHRGDVAADAYADMPTADEVAPF